MNAFTEMYQKIRNIIDTSFRSMSQNNIDRIERQSDENESVTFDPLTTQLNHLYSYPFNVWEAQMFGENMPPLQAHIAFSMIEPPKIAGAGAMFLEAVSNNTYKHLGYQTSPVIGSNFIASFLQRITNLFEAARISNGVGLFYVPTTQTQDETAQQVQVESPQEASAGSGAPPGAEQ